MASTDNTDGSTNDKKRPSTDQQVLDEPIAKRKCVQEKVGEQVFVSLNEHFPETNLKYPCVIRKITALHESRSQHQHDSFAQFCPNGLNVLEFSLAAEDIATRFRDSKDDQNRIVHPQRFVHDNESKFSGLVVTPGLGHEYKHKKTNTSTTVCFSGPRRITTKVSTASRIESAHPLEQAWFDWQKSSNFDARGFFDMSNCNVSSIIVPVLNRQVDTYVQVNVTNGPVTRNMLIGALEQVLEQSFTLEIRHLLWSAVKDADNLDAYNHDGESVQMDTTRQCIGDFLKPRAVVRIENLADLSADFNWLKWALDRPCKETVYLHLEMI